LIPNENLSNPYPSRKKKKNLRLQKKKNLDNAIRKNHSRSRIGQEKKGDLKGIYVHKSKSKQLNIFWHYRPNIVGLELIS
jgi:hypothetical protein